MTIPCAMARLLDLQLHRYAWLIPMGERARRLNEEAKHD